MLKKPTRTALAVKALIEFSDSVLDEDAAFAIWHARHLPLEEQAPSQPRRSTLSPSRPR